MIEGADHATREAGADHSAAPAPLIFLTTDEAAALLRWRADTVRAKAAAGQLPGIRLGRHWRFERDRLLAFIRGEWKPQNSPRAARSIHPGAQGEAARIFRAAREELIRRRKDEAK